MAKYSWSSSYTCFHTWQVSVVFSSVPSFMSYQIFRVHIYLHDADLYGQVSLFVWQCQDFAVLVEGQYLNAVSDCKFIRLNRVGVGLLLKPVRISVLTFLDAFFTFFQSSDSFTETLNFGKFFKFF